MFQTWMKVMASMYKRLFDQFFGRGELFSSLRNNGKLLAT